MLFRSHIVTDELVGQVIIPVEDLFPQFGDDDRATKRDLKGWFEILPLPESQCKYKPAIKTLSSSGMTRPKKSLGKMLVHCELKTSEKVVSEWNMYKTYLESSSKLRRNKSSEYVALNRSLPSEITEDYYEILVNFSSFIVKK